MILTKADGDARGGAALSIRQITGKPIKFIGVGEKTADIEAFHPDRMASRILGMGDVLTLIEEAERKIDHDKAEKIATKLVKGKRFDLEDFAEQIRQMRNMGGITGMLDKLPGMGKVPDQVKNQMNDGQLVRLEAMIQLDDAAGTALSRRHQGLAKATHFGRVRHPDSGCQPSAQAVQSDAEDDEAHAQEGRSRAHDAGPARRPPPRHSWRLIAPRDESTGSRLCIAIALSRRVQCPAFFSRPRTEGR